MKKIWYVPLELLDKRYTILMDTQILEELNSAGLDYAKHNYATK